VQKFCEEQIEYLSTTYSEMMPFDESNNLVRASVTSHSKAHRSVQHIVHSQDKDNM
jgi:hypothetical protein